MNWRWLLFDFTDSRWQLTRRERAAIWARMIVIQERTARRRFPLVVIPGFFGALLINLLVATGTLPSFMVLGAIGAAIYLATVAIAAPFYGQALRQAALELHPELCQSCGYWLRGLSDSITRCPECGAARIKPAAQPEARDEHDDDAEAAA